MLKITKRVTKQVVCLILIFTLVFTLGIGSSVSAAEADTKTVKNVILLIPDGTSITHITTSRWFNDGNSLAMDEIASGLIRTYCSDSIITDSAPAATAMATGNKSHTGYISVLPDVANIPGLKPIAPEDAKKPVATVLEGAKLKGKATGLVATSNIQHATPAAFASHYPDRNNYEVLAEQMVYNNLDVVLGGGSQYLLSEKRKDREDLMKVIKDKGFDYVTNLQGMKNSTYDKIWGMFASDAMAYDYDRDLALEPNLSEMTEKAINVLSKDNDGFFLMVEGSKVDWASHSNDPIGVISELLAFDKAVKVALDFAKKDGNTAVIVAPDHGNGGMSIGSSKTNSGYDKQPLENLINPLKKAKLTGDGVEKKLNADKSNIKEVMAGYYGITDLTDTEVLAIKNAKKGGLMAVVGPMISVRSIIGWNTTGHEGEEVFLGSYHPQGHTLKGVIQNTDIPKYIEEVLKLDLADANQKLFVKARPAFEAKGATVTWDATDVQNPVVVVTKGTDVLKLPVFKNIAELNGRVIEMNGVTVFNTRTVYVPQEAIDLIK